MIPFNDTFTQEEEMFSQEKKRGTKFLEKRCKSWEEKQEKKEGEEKTEVSAQHIYFFPIFFRHLFT